MTAIIKEWVQKAKGDFLTANREFRADPPNYDSTCYHAQQCAEKLIKAVPIDRGTNPPKVHDLVTLSGLLGPSCPERAWPTEELRLLSRAAVLSRYPGETAEIEEAKAALEVCTQMRSRLLVLLQCGNQVP